MNKKGLIFIFLFVVSTVSSIAVANAEQSDNKVEVTLDYIPSAYYEYGEVWVEIDRRMLDNSMVFGANDIIYWSFFYDIAMVSWAYAPGFAAYGDGWQPDNWYFCPVNVDPDVIAEFGLYNETRFAGYFNVYLDDYDLGISDFAVEDDAGSYQEIILDLDIGWHYLTVVAAELVSDANHTEWHWEHAKDQKAFFVGEDRSVVPDPVGLSYNTVELVANEILSEDLGQGYVIDSFAVFPRPVAEATGTSYQVVEETDRDTPLVSTAEFNFNASDHELVLWAPSWYGTEFHNYTEMGNYGYSWFVNDGFLESIESGVTELELYYGMNFIYFNVWGLVLDDYAFFYGDIFGDTTAIASAGHDGAVVRIFVGEPESAGLGFGILISVSILGLVSYAFVRKRK